LVSITNKGQAKCKRTKAELRLGGIFVKYAAQYKRNTLCFSQALGYNLGRRHSVAILLNEIVKS
jgi:hypothetical protein